MLQTAVSGVKNLLVGLGVTFRNMVSKPVTIRYPEIKRKMPERYRGRHFLNRDENGLERCVGCSLCSINCPVGCIHVVSAENTPEHRVSPGERYAEVYEINLLRCIYCGYCEEACPVDAVVLREHYELADYDRDKYIATKEDLLQYPEPNQFRVNILGNTERIHS
ncbi:MAG: NADH-quinone oxidoreductase subunit NuoI [Nitrospinaceae bacterium]|nr:NADH-quinone oxidoreductase subunit NuoI [Nitrospinaceae bacterium]NIR53437.1 NADH-quinone oxidoreductase subunit NuoI [Nitrospinaceae bacterium]NIS83841.1 NADH-quinone oxidoreductase subunit NuoI [Nitrospinaceae bacterium]NIT80632.1 NADH-quinone oxidoreductase subunit NuoI [Nitrospinaceae bacterium]NIU42958.1 NADH-quinone oxidoreductase subunit NuoI [Nitrospinaceae bacterium]